MSSSLFPRRELHAGARRSGKARRVRLEKSKLVIIALCIAIVASFFAGMTVSQRMFAKTVTTTLTFVNIVTKTVVKSVTKTVTIEHNITKTYVPNYVNPSFNLLRVQVEVSNLVPSLRISYSSTGSVIARISMGNRAYVYPLEATNGKVLNVSLPIAAPCKPISNKSIYLEIVSLLGKKLNSTSIRIGSPRIAVSMAQYFLDPKNPHLLQRLQLEVSNYGNGISEISKIVVEVKDEHGVTVAKRVISPLCIYVYPRESKMILTPQLYIPLQSGRYTVYVELENGDGVTLFRGSVGSIVIG